MFHFSALRLGSYCSGTDVFSLLRFRSMHPFVRAVDGAYSTTAAASTALVDHCFLLLVVVRHHNDNNSHESVSLAKLLSQIYR